MDGRADLAYEVDGLKTFMKKLMDEADSGALVVVEGVRDEEALRSLGFKGRVFLLCQGGGVKRLLTVAAGFKKTIVLTDLDRKGRVLAGRIASALQAKNMQVDLYFRRELRCLMRGRVRAIEDLRRFGDYF